MSTKYDFNDGVFLTHFYSCWRAENWHISQKSQIIVIHDVKNCPILKIFSHEPPMSSLYDFKDRVCLTNFYSARELKIGTKLMNPILLRSVTTKITSSSKYLPETLINISACPPFSCCFSFVTIL